MGDFLERVFHLKAAGTSVKTEIVAGITTFMTMAYILAVNPNILSASGMDAGAVFTATALSSCVASILMAGLSNYPFVLAPGMGLNAYFAYTVVLGMGYSWQTALAAVFVEGIIFIILSVTKIREALFNCIPHSLKLGVTCGIGLFITFIGLQNSKIVQADSSTLVTMYPFNTAIQDGSFWSVGIGAVLSVIGVLLIAVLMVRKVKGAILFGILGVWILGIIFELTGLYIPNAELGMASTLPDFSNGIAIPSLAPTFMQMDFSNILSFNFFTVMFAFLFVDLFDTLGTVIGVASKADMLDKDGHLPKIRGVLLADAIGTTAGAMLGTSTVTTYVESSSGVMAGGRTGLTSVVSGLLFGLALFLSPIFLSIPSFATAPALIVVGFMMLSSVLKIDFDDIGEAIPAFIAIIAMPFLYSISEGIALGVISYVVINLVTGKFKTKKISVLMYVLAVIFVLKYIFI
ncbi:MAG TPA: NCS2 family permease [Candidatus Gallacutalibacter pullicola]|uniref:NCS2 family permease n=1 Tax=Candidatus Gallacutalibacter pullicola TaxID=2840830 RepID=A0A9D1J1B9_9FIRM|nr:NCS2 family permease [Candidatus Gallacutalibacter pullicola]